MLLLSLVNYKMYTSNTSGAIALLIIIVIVLFVCYCNSKSHEKSNEDFKYSATPNMRLTPFWYSLFSYDKMQGGAAWPGSLFTRLKFWSPSGASTGSGLTYNTRSGDEKVGYWQRYLWMRNNNNNYYVTNGEDYVHEMADYNKAGLTF